MSSSTGRRIWGPLIDTMGPLRREGLLAQSPTIGNWLRAAAVLTTRDQWTKEKGALSDAVIDAIRKKFGMGWWGVSLRLYGREAVTKVDAADPRPGDVGAEAAQHQAHRLEPGAADRAERLARRAADLSDAERQLVRRSRGHVGFSPVLPQSGSQALEQFRRTYARYKEFGMDYQASFAFGERHLINVNAVLLNKDDASMMSRVDPFLRSLISDARSRGYAEYRTHLDYMDAVAGTYDFQRPRAAPAEREGEERARSRRHHRAGQKRHLAAILCQGAPGHEGAPGWSRQRCR